MITQVSKVFMVASATASIGGAADVPTILALDQVKFKTWTGQHRVVYRYYISPNVLAP
jgi:hypothetical protein